jgi:hypothetical protein
MAPKIMQEVVINIYNNPKVFPAQSHDGALQLWECPPPWVKKSADVRLMKDAPASMLLLKAPLTMAAIMTTA